MRHYRSHDCALTWVDALRSRRLYIRRFQGGLTISSGKYFRQWRLLRGTQSLGNEWMRRFFSEHKIASIQERLERHGVWLIFLLRVNPLTSSDLVSYAAGLTRIPIWKVMTATAFGMAPLCFAQAYFCGKCYATLSMATLPIDRLLCHLFGRFLPRPHSYAEKSIHQITQDISKDSKPPTMPFWSVM